MLSDLTTEGEKFLRACLKSMVRKDQYGKRHTSEDTLLRHKPNTIGGSEAKKVLKWASDKGWMFREKKQGEWHYSLNKEFLHEIYEFIP